MAEPIGAPVALTGQFARRVGDRALSGREDFLRLLITQMRSQTPIRPYDGQEFAVQLAIFSQLEQLLSMRQLLGLQLEQFSGLMAAIGNAAAPALIGTLARAESSTIWLSEEGVVRFGYELSEAAEEVQVEIRTPAGELVRTLEFRQVRAGTHWVEWDGRSASGQRLPAGRYNVRITAVGRAQQAPIPFVEGTVEAVRFTDRGALVLINGVEVPLMSLLEVRKRG